MKFLFVTLALFFFASVGRADCRCKPSAQAWNAACVEKFASDPDGRTCPLVSDNIVGAEQILTAGFDFNSCTTACVAATEAHGKQVCGQRTEYDTVRLNMHFGHDKKGGKAPERYLDNPVNSPRPCSSLR